MSEASAGTLLGGRVRHDQPALATAPASSRCCSPPQSRARGRARAGRRHAAPAPPCFASPRGWPGSAASGIERDPALAALAERNAAANGFAGLSLVLPGDLATGPAGAEAFDHAFANPPWHAPPAPPRPIRGARRARRRHPGCWRCGRGAGRTAAAPRHADVRARRRRPAGLPRRIAPKPAAAAPRSCRSGRGMGAGEAAAAARRSRAGAPRAPCCRGWCCTRRRRLYRRTRTQSCATVRRWRST